MIPLSMNLKFTPKYRAMCHQMIESQWRHATERRHRLGLHFFHDCSYAAGQTCSRAGVCGHATVIPRQESSALPQTVTA